MKTCDCLKKAKLSAGLANMPPATGANSMPMFPAEVHIEKASARLSSVLISPSITRIVLVVAG